MDEEIIYNKIYARANANGIVTHIFSEAFETPLETDVCIDETNTDRHGAQKYPVRDENGFYNYEIRKRVLYERDKTADYAKRQAAELNAAYIPSAEASMRALFKKLLYDARALDDEEKLAVSGLAEGWKAGVHEVGELCNYAGQTYECYTAHSNAEYPDITPDNPQTFANFWRPLHGKSVETARPWAKPQYGTTDMYKAGEYMVYTDGKVYKCLSDTVYSPEEYAQAWEVQA